jgi:hypothetical protein
LPYSEFGTKTVAFLRRLRFNRIDRTIVRIRTMATTHHAPTPRAPHENPEKDPEDWVTGDEPMTGPQRSYLQTLCQEAKEAFDETLTKAEASRRIDELQRKTGRGDQQGQ